ncbi:MAG: nucleotidyl transferase AbiEii/AbiGii toxin family protein [Thermodesulfobacteriota bacterium]|jgi:predicted nucleotidyltransferase component of viral defense system|nr:MAG: nucleotidyl transferase AbiEii/AbiGii toxin family protein [Thermodesulfobacteriota bacterium]
MTTIMETIKPALSNIISESPSRNNLLKRNLLKEYLQIVVLDFMYSHPVYSRLIFYGGSALAHCFDLQRLSEDLDFIDETKKVNISKLAKDLEDYFSKRTDLDVTTTVQKFRIYLKFPILRDLGISNREETDNLFLKVEVYSKFDFCERYTTDIRPIFKFNRSVLIKTLDPATLMATKIRAILFRKWEKTDKQGKTTAKVKGRDYFDLLWYLQKGIKPNLSCIEGFDTMEDLKEKLLAMVGQIDNRSIQLDLESLINNPNFVKNMSRNIKTILKREISEKL